jgi:poly(hydroxyalkanoate) granule-associated protein
MSATTKKETTKQPMLRESAERIWLAGLGALALTEEQGTKLFKSLVKKGEGFERQTRSLLDKQIASVRHAPSTAVRRLEGGVEQTMTGMLHRFGIPTRREINTLTRRVELLADSLEKQASTRRHRNGKPRTKLVAASATETPAAP